MHRQKPTKTVQNEQFKQFDFVFKVINPISSVNITSSLQLWTTVEEENITQSLWLKS